MFQYYKKNKAPSLIKTDVEGFELNVLRGSEKFLETHNFPPVLFEAWDLDWFKDEKSQLLKFLAYLGYEISLNIKQEFVAQHPKNSIHINFQSNENGGINMIRTK